MCMCVCVRGGGGTGKRRVEGEEINNKENPAGNGRQRSKGNGLLQVELSFGFCR